MPIIADSPQVFDDQGDHALGDMCLAKTDFVSHEEPNRRISLSEQPLECP